MKILIVDDEPQILKGVSRIISCEESSWDVATAESGPAALAVLERHSFDVVVSDMNMPGMDGAELLEEIAQRYPSMLRVILSGQVNRESVLSVVKPMHQYLAKPCEPETLFAVIKRAEILQDTIRSTEILAAIGRANCLPSPPEIVSEINAELDSENGSSRSIAAIVARDPILTARLLQLANSVIFGFRSKISDIDRAVSLVGVDIVRSVAMSQAVFSQSQKRSRLLPAQRLLDHGFQVAMLGKLIAENEQLTLEQCNSVFTAGLLHDVGKLILMDAYPDEYERIVIQGVSADRTLEQLEMETFDATHQGIGGYLFSLWGLPPEITNAIASHHSFSLCAKATRKPCQLVYAANWIASRLGIDALQQQVDTCEHPRLGAAFANRILSWQDLLNKLDYEETDHG